MNQQLNPLHRQESILEDGMLFVRTESILQTMAKLPILLAGFIIMAVAMPFQNSYSSTKSMDLIIYSDGSTHISSEIEVDSLEVNFALSLFGNEIDNFVAIGENDVLLSAEIVNDTATVGTFGSSTISINYDIHDLVSKEGRIWTFTLDAPADYTLLMPENSVIVGMSALPLNMEIVDEKTRLVLPNGLSEINYVFGTSTMFPPTPTPENEFDSTLIIIGGAVAAAGTIGAVLLKRSQKKPERIATTTMIETGKPVEPETIFNLRPDLREDDKELINFIFNNGGQAFESELRKKFLQPRTTMWRAVKRLERQGIIEIVKKDLQNLVKLRNDLEEEN
ncbi:MAG: MarR family transcriptional regulator [Thaumarchaeota archaeon]|nr:MarR family transcriptional regulator [Nitrososphaerota archaeon]